jgi:hypothetical protein
MPYGNLLADVVQGSTANTPPVFKDGNGTTIGTLCRAWVNFNGTGTVAIRASFNVSSITDNGAGDYTVNFTTAMPDVNYAVMVSVQSSDAVGTNYNSGYIQSTAYSTSSIRVGCINSTDGVNDRDTPSYNLVVFR